MIPRLNFIGCLPAWRVYHRTLQQVTRISCLTVSKFEIQDLNAILGSSRTDRENIMDAKESSKTDAFCVERAPMEAWELVGNTPLLRLRNIAATSSRIEIYAKAEWFNPGGSVKDRPALGMILDGEREGRLTSRKIILDATSGNTGIAYAWIGAARGYKVKLALPQNASEERKRILKSYGASSLTVARRLGRGNSKRVGSTQRT
jgi:predicted alternative tryptophan synthase beta-subunit